VSRHLARLTFVADSLTTRKKNHHGRKDRHRHSSPVAENSG
jgi:hypothetical protein